MSAEQRLLTLENYVKGLEQRILVLEKKDPTSTLDNMKLPDLKDQMRALLKQKNVEDALKIESLITEKENAYKVLNSWDEVSRYVNMKMTGQVHDLRSYIDLKLPIIQNRSTYAYKRPYYKKTYGKYNGVRK